MSEPLERRPLGSLVTITGGGTPSKARPEYYQGDVPWVTPKDMKSWDITDAQDHITEEAIAQSATKLIEPGSVLLVIRSGDSQAHTANRHQPGAGRDQSRHEGAQVRTWPRPGLPGARAAVVRPEDPGTARATTADNIPLDVVRRLEVPVLPLAEQRRVAAILDRADATRRKRQLAIQLTDDLLRSAFLDVFGDPVTNPKRWPTGTLGAALASVEAGWSAKGDDRPRAHDEWAVLKISAVTSRRFDPSHHKVVDEPGPKKPRRIPRRGDLLFSRANTRELVGAVALVERDEQRLFLPDKLWRLVRNRQVALPEYLRFVLGHPGYQRSLASHATGTSGSMLNVSQAKLLKMRLPVPPVAHQERFAAFVWNTYDAQGIINRSAIELDSFFESLVQRAFRGELTVAADGQGTEGESGQDRG